MYCYTNTYWKLIFIRASRIILVLFFKRKNFFFFIGQGNFIIRQYKKYFENYITFHKSHNWLLSHLVNVIFKFAFPLTTHQLQYLHFISTPILLKSHYFPSNETTFLHFHNTHVRHTCPKTTQSYNIYIILYLAGSRSLPSGKCIGISLGWTQFAPIHPTILLQIFSLSVHWKKRWAADSVPILQQPHLISWGASIFLFIPASRQAVP